jgi:hypothetical protein
MWVGGYVGYGGYVAEGLWRLGRGWLVGWLDEGLPEN